MAKQLYANNASALLAASISDSDLTIQVDAGYGTLFPLPGAGEYFLATLENSDGDLEVVKVTTRSTDLLTVASGGRGQEGTSAQSWTNGQTRVEVRLTKGILETFLQRAGDTLDGDLDFQLHRAKDVKVTGESVWTGGQLVDVPLRGALDDDSNEVLVPADGSRATAGGANILCEGDDLGTEVFHVGMIMEWYGALIDLPDGWHQCDGTNGTPDLRNKFVIGVGSDNILGASGGLAASAAGTTGSGGAHSHTASSGNTILDADDIPVHTHRLWVNTADETDANCSGFGGAGVAIGGMDVAGDGTGDYSNTTGGHQLVENAGAGGGGDGHNHTVSVDSGGAHTHSTPAISIIPPYVALYKIMYIGV